jgi:hypothetical protein
MKQPQHPTLNAQHSTLNRGLAALITVYCLLSTGLLAVDSTINTNTTQQSSYGANIGWMNWRANTTNGAVVGEFVLSGNIWGANVGWINLGTGNPTNGIQYTNLSTNDFGVNNGGANNLSSGELSGYAYGANIGWLVFTNRSAAGPLLSSEVPKIDLASGRFTGFAYGANVGWISLSNAQAFVKTDTCIAGADTDGDGIADAWELQYAGNLTTLSGAGHDQDGDGVSDVDEYLADTNPMQQNDNLRITAVSANSGGTTSTVTWTSRPTRLYQVQSRESLVTGAWSTNTPPGLVAPDAGTLTTRDAPGNVTTQRFFRVQAIRPLGK